jgi:hypothetical protein
VRHPLDAIPPRRRPLVFLPLLALTIVLSAWLGAVDGPLRTPAAPLGIVSFQLAGSVEAAEAVLASWDPSARAAAGFSLGLDFLFLLAYPTCLAFGCLWAGRALERRRAPAAAALAAPVAWAQCVVAAADAGENVALLRVLVHGARAPWPALARGFALVKFGLLGVGLAYLGCGLLAHFGIGRAGGSR